MTSLEVRDRLLREKVEVNGQDLHFYRDPASNLLLPSVTTVKDVIAKPRLEKWKMNAALEWAVDALADWVKVDDEGGLTARFPKNATIKLLTETGGGGGTASAGTVIHNLFEHRLKGKEVRVPERYEAAMRHFEEFLDLYHVETLFVEEAGVNRTVGYGGSSDALLTLDGPGLPGPVNCIVDWKSGAGVYADIALQLTGYAKIEYFIIPDRGDVPVPRVDKTLGLWVRREGWALYDIEYSPRTWAAFVGAKRILDFQLVDWWRVRGNPINPSPLRKKGEDW